MRTFARAAVGAATVAVLCSPVVAHAQSASGFALDRFNPSERGSEWFVNDSLDLRGDQRPVLGIVGDFAARPLVLYNADGTPRAVPVRYQFLLHFGGAVNLWDRVRLAADVPISIYQDGSGGTVNGVTYAPTTSGGLGDVRVSADVRLLGKYGDVVTLAAGVQAFLPTGDRDSYLGDKSLRLIPRVLVAGDIGAFVYSANVGFHYRALDDAFGGSPRGSELVGGVAAGLRVADKKLVVGPEIYGATVVTNSDALGALRTTPLEGLIGAHYSFAERWRVGGGVATGLNRGFGEPRVRYVFSLELVPGIAPPPPSDRDGDGVVDEKDACPDVPGVKTDDPKTNGCPPEKKVEPPPPPKERPDRDGDGVFDDEDACIDVKGVRTDDPKTNGCPPDRDGDGILDADDACPDVKGVKTNDPKTNGCPPPPPDRDNDGIPDAEDACPDAAGPRDPDPKKNGCPVQGIHFERDQIILDDVILFETNVGRVRHYSFPLVQRLAQFINAHPEIVSVSIEGHTDESGTSAYNRLLSQARAESVKNMLIRFGVDRRRLTTQGWGKDRPIDLGHDEEAHKKNRRVEFIVTRERSAPGTGGP